MTTAAFGLPLYLASRSMTVHEPNTDCIGVRGINHLGDEVMKVFKVT